LLLGILLTASGYGLLKYIFPFIAFVFNAPTESTGTSLLWKSTSVGLLNAPKIIAAAVAIKLMKYWWLKQKEKEYLEKEKIETELQLLKAQIRPEFLFTTLNNIYAYSLARSVRAPDMLMKLSDLLSYMLYECEAPVVSAEKEIEMMKQYMVLEKIRQNERLDLEINVKGELAGKKLAPFLLLPFIENSFRQINVATEQAWLNMEIKVEGDCFLMKLVNGTQSEETAASCFQTQGLVNVQKRLTLLYPGRHELKLTKEGEMALVFLHLQLEPIEESNTFTALQKNISR
jgi:LytS/YehU family sensor histidine kinase